MKIDSDIIKDLYINGTTISNISKITKLSTQAIRNRLKKLEIYDSKRDVKIIKIDSEIINMYLNNISVPKISKITGVNEISIRRGLRKLEIYDPKRDVKITDYKNLDFFHEINSEEKSYWLGFIYADGYISENNRIGINLNKKDSEHLQKIGDIFNKKLYFLKDYNDVMLTIYNKELWEDLNNHGIEVLKTYDTTTNILNFISKDLERHFIRGYFDGDGSVGYQNNNKRLCYFTLISGCYNFIEETQLIIENSIPNINCINIHKDNLYKLTYRSHKDIINIYNWLYKNSTIYLNRKKEKFEEIIAEIKYKTFKRNQYRGVYKHSSGNYWKSVVYFDKKSRYIGNFKSEIKAAEAHDIEQVKLREIHAKDYLNFPSNFNNLLDLYKKSKSC